MDATTKNALIIVVAMVFVGALIFYGLTYGYFAPAAPGKYSQGLLAKLRVQDDTSGTLITSNVNVGYYGAATDSSGRGIFDRYSTLNPTTSASYDSTKGFWLASLNSGSYTLVVYDTRGVGSATLYPTKVDCTVPTTNSEDLEVVPNPSTAHLTERSAISEALAITGYNTTGGFSTANLDVKTGAGNNNYTSFRMEFTFTLTGLNTEVKAGRIYFTKITELPVTRVLVNGAEVTIGEDTTAGEDGLTGYYVEFSDWQGGATATPTVVYCTVYLEYSGGLTADTTFTMTLADYYAVQRTTIKWWTYTTDPTTVKAT
jgi:hypothetical protein